MEARGDYGGDPGQRGTRAEQEWPAQALAANCWYVDCRVLTDERDVLTRDVYTDSHAATHMQR